MTVNSIIVWLSGIGLVPVMLIIAPDGDVDTFSLAWILSSPLLQVSAALGFFFVGRASAGSLETRSSQRLTVVATLAVVPLWITGVMIVSQLFELTTSSLLVLCLALLVLAACVESLKSLYSSMLLVRGSGAQILLARILGFTAGCVVALSLGAKLSSALAASGFVLIAALVSLGSMIWFVHREANPVNDGSDS